MGVSKHDAVRHEEEEEADHGWVGEELSGRKLEWAGLMLRGCWAREEVSG